MNKNCISHFILALALAAGGCVSAVAQEAPAADAPAAAAPGEAWLQGLNVTSNALLWAMGSVNVGVQLPFGERWHVGIDGGWGKWPLRGDARGTRLSTVGVELRRYFKPDANTDQDGFCRTLRMDRGFFVGVDARISHFNHRPGRVGREGNLVSAGITAGYSWNFAYRWGIDLALGAGYRYADFEKYAYYAPLGVNAWLGDGRGHSFGLTRAEATFVYRFEL